MDIITTWFNEALDLKAGESINIPVISKKEAQRTQKAFLKQKDAVLKIAPEKAYLVNIKFSYNQAEQQHYVILEKIGTNPFTALKKGPGGVVTVTLSTKKRERERRRMLMLRDGYSVDEINNLEKKEDAEVLKIYEPEVVR